MLHQHTFNFLSSPTFPFTKSRRIHQEKIEPSLIETLYSPASILNFLDIEKFKTTVIHMYIPLKSSNPKSLIIFMNTPSKMTYFIDLTAAGRMMLDSLIRLITQVHSKSLDKDGN